MLPDNTIANDGVRQFVDAILSEFINPILALFTVAAICYFTITVIQFYTGYKNGGDMNKLKAKLVWGLAGVIIVASCWTLTEIMYGFRFQ